MGDASQLLANCSCLTSGSDQGSGEKTPRLRYAGFSEAKLIA